MKKMSVQKSSIQGCGIFADEDIKKYEHIAFIQGTYVKRVNHTKKEAQQIPLWYGITETLWINPGKTIFRYLNHCCEPSAAIIGTKKLIALKRIMKGEEITMDYAMTDGDILWEMPCSCKSKTCRKIIRSIQRTPERTIQKHMPHIPRYFISLYNRTRGRNILKV